MSLYFPGGEEVATLLTSVEDPWWPHISASPPRSSLSGYQTVSSQRSASLSRWRSGPSSHCWQSLQFSDSTRFAENILKIFSRLNLSSLCLTCIELQVVGRPPMRCLRSGGRMLSRILFSCSRAAEEGPRLLTTLEAEMTMDDFTEYSVYSAVSILFTVLYCCTGVN